MSAELASGLYDIPQEMVDFRETVRQIATEKVAPRAGDIDRNAEYPHDIRKIFGERTSSGCPSRRRATAPGPAR
jgi:hypothetical protein